MTDQQYDNLLKKLDKVIENQIINGNNIITLERKLNTLQEDMATSLYNDGVIERYFKGIQEDIQLIKRAVNI